MPMLASGTGRTFAAFLPPAMVDVLIQRELADSRRRAAAGNIRSRTALTVLLDAVRQAGMAGVTGEMMPGVHALSGPLFDRTGLTVACLTCMGTAWPFDSVLDGRVARALFAAARQVSAQMGDVTPG